MRDHYIRLLTDVELTDRQQYIWRKTVEKFIDDPMLEPESFIQGLDIRDEFLGDENFPYVYVIYLSEDPNHTDVEKIVLLLSKVYPRDFEIETSAEYSAIYDIDIDDALHKEIQQRASKFFHNMWVENKIQEGWRFGLASDSSSKVSPKLRDWDSLNEQYRSELNITKKQAIHFLKTYPHLFV